MHYALVSSLDGSVEKIFPFMNMYRSAFAERLGANCRSMFLKIVNLREQEYVTGIYKAFASKDAAIALRVYGSMARRITGHFDEELQSWASPRRAALTSLK
jgi:hypothetical protein